MNKKLKKIKFIAGILMLIIGIAAVCDNTISFDMRSDTFCFTVIIGYIMLELATIGDDKED